MPYDVNKLATIDLIQTIATRLLSEFVTKINALPTEHFLDSAKTTFVQSFSFNSTTYQGATNPNLNGKPVLVLALKGIDHANNNAESTSYIFIDLAFLADTGKADKVGSATAGNVASLDANGNLQDSGIAKTTVAIKATNPTAGHVAGVDANGNPTDAGIALNDVLTTANVVTNAESAELITAVFGS